MVQALINLAVVLRLLPIAGVPLPLVSYGGSALIANLLALGVLLSCARHEPDARRLLEARKRKRSKRRVSAVVGSRPDIQHECGVSAESGRSAWCWPAAGRRATPRR